MYTNHHRERKRVPNLNQNRNHLKNWARSNERNLHNQNPSHAEMKSIFFSLLEVFIRILSFQWNGYVVFIRDNDTIILLFFRVHCRWHAGVFANVIFWYVCVGCACGCETNSIISSKFSKMRFMGIEKRIRVYCLFGEHIAHFHRLFSADSGKIRIKWKFSSLSAMNFLRRKNADEQKRRRRRRSNYTICMRVFR